MNEENLNIVEGQNSTEIPSPVNSTLDAALDSIITEPVTEEILPTNSREILYKEEFSRFSSAYWADVVAEKRVTLAGLGGIGSFVAFLLSRLNIENLRLFDNDVVERVNISGQLCDIDSINERKVASVCKILRNFSNYGKYSAYPRNFETTDDGTDIMICGFDNMEARRIFFEAWKTNLQRFPESAKNQCLFIDGRLAAESFQIYCIKGDDRYNIQKYEQECLFTDEEAETTVCSYKQTSFCANMIASYITNLFVNFCVNEKNGYLTRPLPFRTFYDASCMFLRLEN